MQNLPDDWEAVRYNGNTADSAANVVNWLVWTSDKFKLDVTVQRQGDAVKLIQGKQSLNIGPDHWFLLKPGAENWLVLTDDGLDAEVRRG